MKTLCIAVAAVVIGAVVGCGGKEDSPTPPVAVKQNPPGDSVVSEKTEIVPAPVKKQWSQSASEISQNLVQVLDAKADSLSGAINNLFKGVQSKEDIIAMCGAANNSDKDLLKILYLAKQGVPIGETDASLKWIFEDNKVVKNVIELFDSENVSGCFVGLEQYPPEQLKNVINAIVEVPYFGGYLPEGAPTTTWSSRRLKTAMQNIRLAELARRSVAVRLVAEDAKILPDTADAVFDWSGWPTIKIDLTLPPFGERDIPALKRLAQSQNEFFKTAAAKALDVIGK